MATWSSLDSTSSLWQLNDLNLRSSIEALLFRADPIGINFVDSTDEFSPEALTILERLPSLCSESDVVRIVHEEFVRWFDEPIAGSPERYRAVAAEIWQLWRKTRAS